MGNLTLKFIFVLSCAFVFANQTNAQLCGKYTTTLQIKTADDKPIENAVIQLLPIEKDETRGKTFVRDEKDFSKFSITFLEGHQLTANYRLIISADGFETSEREIKFPHCKKQSFDIQLNAKRKESYTVLSGYVKDSAGALIEKVQVITTNTKTGKEYSSYTNSDGFYKLYLSKGQYNIKFAGISGFLPTLVEDFNAVKEKYNLNISMDLDMECSTCIFSEFECKPKKDNKDDLDCVYVSRQGKGGSKPKTIKFSDNENNK